LTAFALGKKGRGLVLPSDIKKAIDDYRRAEEPRRKTNPATVQAALCFRRTRSSEDSYLKSCFGEDGKEDNRKIGGWQSDRKALSMISD
jgi:hypothetical protein